ncbi:MAG: cation transporter [Roseovarius sp.]|nr:cation transporter [Roseovarius sp.]
MATTFKARLDRRAQVMVKSRSSAQTVSAGSSEYALKRKVTLIGGGVNLVLAAGKVFFGFVGQSQALIADGIHSLSDLISDVFVLVATRFASQGPDTEHPYGHGRFETIATVAIGLLLLAVAAGFIYDAAQRLFSSGDLWTPGWIALGAAFVSVVSKEVLYRYTIVVGRRVRSRLIEANAWHHRSDSLSSLVVIVGVLGAMAGFAWFDAVAAIIVAIMIGVMGGQFAWRSLRELVDTGLDREALTDLRAIIDQVDGVRSHHDLRSRCIGKDVLIDVHIVVDPELSVADGHGIGDAVRTKVMQRIDNAAEVLVRVDVE